MTDGGIYYSNDGNIIRKYNIQDGYGIKKIIKSGLNLAVITMSNEKNIKIRMKSLGIKNYFFNIHSKLSVVSMLSKKMNIKMSEIAFLGDDLNDMEVMKKVGLPVSVSNAVSEIKKITLFTTTLPGGSGAIRQVCDLIIKIKKY
jgi:3-deoxy-D-manno-octulosonate 8-phosphate phosphatase (KDO 8-P phosphatase)